LKKITLKELMMAQMSDNEISNIADRIMEKMEEDKKNLPSSRKDRLTLTTPYGTVYEAGQLFEAKTVKGGINYVMFLLNHNGFAYYLHGDRAKKTPLSNFIDLIGGGDLNPIDRKNADPERLALASLSLHAMLNGLAFGDYLKMIWGKGDGSEI
jgi:hypothetical protein